MPRRPSSARADGRIAVGDERPRRRRRAGRRGGSDRPRERRRRAPAPGRGSRAAASRAAGGPGGRRRRGAAGGRVGAAGGQQRVVGEDGADADRDRVGFGAPAVDQLAAALAGDPGGVAGRGRGAAVERHRQLQGDQRQAGAGVLAEGLVEQPRGGRLLAGGELDLDAAVAEDPRPAPGGLLARIVGGDHDPRDPRLRGSPPRRAAAAPGARKAPASRTSSPRPGSSPRSRAVGQRRPLSVQPAQLGVEPLADHLAVAHDHRSDQRIRADPPPPALGQLQRPLQVVSIRACELGVHATD